MSTSCLHTILKPVSGNRTNFRVTTTTAPVTNTAKGHLQLLLDVDCGITGIVFVPYVVPSAGHAVDVAVAVAASAVCRDWVDVGVLVVAMAVIVLLW